jgi:hypothetical protein
VAAPKLSRCIGTADPTKLLAGIHLQKHTV